MTSEWRRVALYTLFILIITTLPYILAAGRGGEAWRFNGFLFGVEDGNAYLGKMRLGMRGEWNFYLFYTPEQHRAEALVVLPYILVGQITGLFIPDTSPQSASALMLAFHLMRIVCVALLIPVIYLFIAQFLHAPASRLFTLVLATLGGGFGWLLALLGQSGWLGSLPPDFYIPEGFSFLVIFGLPHLALARAALLGGFILLIRSQRKHSKAERRKGDFDKNAFAFSLLAGVCWLVMGISVPFYLAVVYAILGAWGLAAWVRQGRFPIRLFLHAVTAGAVTLPFFLYNSYIFIANPAFVVWSAQNVLPSPHPLHYIVAYLLIGGLAAFGAGWAWRRAAVNIRYALLIGWVLIVPILVYLPLNVQRRMSEAVIVPLAILAAAGVNTLVRRGRARGAVMVAASMTSVFLLFGSTLAALNPRLPLFRPAAEVEMLHWLNANSTPDDVVLASVATGNVIPAYAHVRTFMGHGPETLDWQDKTALLQRFYRGEMTAAERAELFAPTCPESIGFCLLPIRYILYGPLERALAPDTPPTWTEGLTLVYDADGYQIYRASEVQSSLSATHKRG